MNKLKAANLGCGNEYFESTENIEWLNVDLQENDGKVDYKADVSQKLPFFDETFDIIVASHIFEHIEMSRAQEVLEEWMRCLKRDGKLYLTVPDARALAEAYVTKDITHYIFAVNMTGPYHNGVWDHHRWAYDFDELKDRAKNFNIHRLSTENDLTEEVKYGKVKLDWWILGVIITYK